MEFLEIAQKTLWYAPIGIEAIILFVLAKRRLYRELPIFTAYLAFVCVHDLALATLFEPFSVAYFYTFWITELITIALGFAVLYEVFDIVLKPYESVHRIGNFLFLIVAVVLAAVAVGTAATAPRGNSHPLVAAILTAEIAVRIIQTGLALFLFIFSSALGLTWRHVVFGVAMGFGVYAATELIVVTMRSYFGTTENSAYVLLKQAAFTCSVFIWAAYTLRREPVILVQGLLPDRDQIAAWNQTLAEYLHQ
jgi:hypothetical protein